VYFVHSFCALPSEANSEWISAVTDYGNQRYISMIQKGNVIATQFHPEKSGQTGLKIIASFLLRNGKISPVFHPDSTLVDSTSMVKLSEVLDYSRYPQTCMSKRVIACLDVRSNDDGDLVVTKGDQYDVREASHDSSGK
jgi:glutamine amidotransferase/cyclase